jgi:glycosyltransferase involved in cell wall biosynthesis
LTNERCEQMRDPSVTVAMPFFNSAATLELAIRSILSQTYDDFELLLCDDGSTDDGLEIARSFDDPRVVCWQDGRRRRLAPRLNECIDRARGRYFARMDADDIAYPERLARQLTFLKQNTEIDLCGGGTMVFRKEGQPLWRYSPEQVNDKITRAPFKGFPLWHPTWMGRTEWFRRWRYDEGALLAQDHELLLRSYRDSVFANLPEIILGYRQEAVSLKKLFRYKLLSVRYACNQPAGGPNSREAILLIALTAARFAANCLAMLAGPERRLGHQGARAPSPAELVEWQDLWISLAAEFTQTNNTVRGNVSSLQYTIAERGNA